MATVEEYISGKPEHLQPRLKELRALIAGVLTNSTQALKWNDLAFVHADGVILAMLSVHKIHCNVVVTPSSLAAMADDFSGFKLGKGSVQVPHNQSVPRVQIRALIASRLREYENEGVKWM